MDVRMLTIDETMEQFQRVTAEALSIADRLDGFMPLIRQARESAEHAIERHKTSRMVNAEAFRIGLESGFTRIEDCLEIQALIEACEYEEDKQAARAFFGFGVVSRA